MRHPKTIAWLLALAAMLSSRGLVAQDDVADVPATEQRVGGDDNKHYLLIQRKEVAPERGYGLVVVLPGGDGSAEFSPFVRRICKNGLPEGYLVAEPIAVKWTANQQIVWPTKKLRVPGMKFTTEEFVAGVIDDVTGKEKLDPARIFVLGWSSGGAATYAVTLSTAKVRGALVAMAVFKPDQLPLDGAKDKAFYLYHSPEDKVSPFRFAEQAVKDLEKHGAKVLLEEYAGGHGWRGDVFGDQRAGIEWLEANAKEAAPGSETAPATRIAPATETVEAPRPNDLTGRVLDGDGEPIADATLLVVQKTWPGGKFQQDAFDTVSDADGKFKLPNLIPDAGQFQILVVAFRPGYAFASRYQTQKAAGPRTFKPITSIEGRTIRFHATLA